MFSPFSSFEAAARQILQHLRKELGFQAWLVTRFDGDQLTIEHCEGEYAGAQKGMRLSWDDSICSRMMRGLGPNIAPNVSLVPAYKDAPLAKHHGVAAYIGYPLCDSDGLLFGTVCALDSQPQDSRLQDKAETILLFVKLLCTQLSLFLKVESYGRKSKQIHLEKLVDAETGLLSQVAWQSFLTAQHKREQALGVPCCIAKLKPHANPNATLSAVGQVVREVLGPTAVLSNHGYQELWIGLPNCQIGEAQSVVSKACDSVRDRLKLDFESTVTPLKDHTPGQ